MGPLIATNARARTLRAGRSCANCCSVIGPREGTRCDRGTADCDGRSPSAPALASERIAVRLVRAVMIPPALPTTTATGRRYRGSLLSEANGEAGGVVG